MEQNTGFAIFFFNLLEMHHRLFKINKRVKLQGTLCSIFLVVGPFAFYSKVSFLFFSCMVVSLTSY